MQAAANRKPGDRPSILQPRTLSGGRPGDGHDGPDPFADHSRSGRCALRQSRFAERLCAGSGLDKVYVATGAAHDGEMAERIALHREQRGPSWTTLEEQIDLTGVLTRECRPDRVVLVDCLTLWLSNLLFADKDLAHETQQLADAVAGLAGPCLLSPTKSAWASCRRTACRGRSATPRVGSTRLWREPAGRLSSSPRGCPFF